MLDKLATFWPLIAVILIAGAIGIYLWRTGKNGNVVAEVSVRAGFEPDLSGQPVAPEPIEVTEQKPMGDVARAGYSAPVVFGEPSAAPVDATPMTSGTYVSIGPGVFDERAAVAATTAKKKRAATAKPAAAKPAAVGRKPAAKASAKKPGPKPKAKTRK